MKRKLEELRLNFEHVQTEIYDPLIAIPSRKVCASYPRTENLFV